MGRGIADWNWPRSSYEAAMTHPIRQGAKFDAILKRHLRGGREMSRSVQAVVGGFACLFACVLVPGVAGASGLTVSRKIHFVHPASVRKPIRDTCDLQTRIPAAVAKATNARLVEGRGSLDLAISDVHGPGGWIFSGPKWVEVTGKLRRGRKVVGSFRAKRYSAFNPFAGGTCGILARCGRALAADIAAWVENPTKNAVLGNAR